MLYAIKEVLIYILNIIIKLNIFFVVQIVNMEHVFFGNIENVEVKENIIIMDNLNQHIGFMDIQKMLQNG